MQRRLVLISITKIQHFGVTSWSSVYFRKTLYFLICQRNIEVEKIELSWVDRSHQNKQGFEGKMLSGKELAAFEEFMCGRHSRLGELRIKILAVFLPRFPGLFCLLSSWILQNNLLDLYSVKIRRFRLSFFKNRHKSVPHRPPFFSVFINSGTTHIIVKSINFLWTKFGGNRK